MTGISEELRAACADEWRKAHDEHPFVIAMGDGTLSLERFQYFMRQDYLFLIDYARVLAIATAKSLELESMGHWAALLDETLNSEMELHRGFCADFGITIKELESTEEMPATAAYTDHLLRTAYDGDIYELSAALLPCQWGYDEVAQHLATVLKATEGSFHARWVAGYNAPAYRELTAWLRGFVDALGRSATAVQKERMLKAFRASTHYEYLFWDAAWTLQEWLGV
jgi:thiaminase/transcriptional activator TenA